MPSEALRRACNPSTGVFGGRLIREGPAAPADDDPALAALPLAAVCGAGLRISSSFLSKRLRGTSRSFKEFTKSCIVCASSRTSVTLSAPAWT